ncbi:MAG: DUF2066 domain-containing protein [Parashewanella sp.]
MSAVSVNGLDRASVPVNSQSFSQRKFGYKTALKQVLLKNSGSESIFDNTLIKQAVAKPEPYISQFSFVGSNDNLMLEVAFVHQKIIELLKHAGVPIWGNQRPQTIFWIVQQNQNESTILSDDPSNEFIHALKQTADSSGIPIAFPLMDFDEITSISAADINGLFLDKIPQASSRYQAEYFVLLSVSEKFDGIDFELNVYPQQQDDVRRPVLTKSGQVESYQKLSIFLVNALSNLYSQTFSITGNDELSKINIAFDDIVNLKQAMSVEKYINNLSIVKSAFIAGLSGSRLRLELTLYGSQGDLQRILALDPKVSSQQNSDFLQVGSKSSNYQWNGG